MICRMKMYTMTKYEEKEVSRNGVKLLGELFSHESWEERLNH